MSDDATQSPRPMANLLKEVKDGNLTIRLSADDFINIDRDCESFKRTIKDMQTVAQDIASQQAWGCGESPMYCQVDLRTLVSGETVVNRFRKKAQDDPNSIYKILDQHLQIVEDIQEAHRIVRDRLVQSDAEFAAAFNSKKDVPDTRPQVKAPDLSSRPK
ncbi:MULTISPECIES: hypothetical protein [unclassified Nocardia]|uniref:hypothetical protein n=1 Tax=unclassified Nocardia TaxID=2637762 RepID=UPI001CE4696A|nr:MULTISPECIES: hypothetical protein [unclassified Nocardia]